MRKGHWRIAWTKGAEEAEMLYGNSSSDDLPLFGNAYRRLIRKLQHRTIAIERKQFLVQHIAEVSNVSADTFFLSLRSKTKARTTFLFAIVDDEVQTASSPPRSIGRLV
ncbi:unnamed protein product [Linum trigynum]|uniref:Uncharacterized protein n=1 Tax=Linum trigynum TaxID=586398 RepID=A0AAV2DYS3_9ROSI